MNLAQKASERRLQRRALEQQEKSVDEFVKSVDALVPGCRVDFKRPNNSALRCRLSWVSPERMRFVFHARPTQQVFVLASDMLAQLLRKHGFDTRIVNYDAASRSQIGTLDTGAVSLVCVSFLEILGQPPHVRYLIRRLRSRLPKVPVIVGLWAAGDQTLEDEDLRQMMGADAYSSSLRDMVIQAVERVRSDDSE